MCHSGTLSCILSACVHCIRPPFSLTSKLQQKCHRSCIRYNRSGASTVAAARHPAHQLLARLPIVSGHVPCERPAGFAYSGARTHQAADLRAGICWALDMAAAGKISRVCTAAARPTNIAMLAKLLLLLLIAAESHPTRPWLLGGGASAEAVDDAAGAEEAAVSTARILTMRDHSAAVGAGCRQQQGMELSGGGGPEGTASTKTPAALTGTAATFLGQRLNRMKRPNLQLPAAAIWQHLSRCPRQKQQP